MPIIEPEVLSDGTHSIEECAQVSEQVFNAVIQQLVEQGLLLEGLLVKPNMCLEGAQTEKEADPEEVAFFTVRTLSRTIPPAIPGITFLSGGQSEERACKNLNAMNNIKDVKHPWALAFSFGRALQSTSLKLWDGKDENAAAAQANLVKIAKACSEASLGEYKGGAGAEEKTYVANYVY